MIRYLTVQGAKQPADFSIMTLAQVARKYDVDVTGLGELLGSKSALDEQFELLATIGVVALNNGARREGLDKRYSEFDLYDAFTADLELTSEIIVAFGESFQSSTVFQTPARKPATKRDKKAAE